MPTMSNAESSTASLGTPDSIHPVEWTSNQVTRWLSTLAPATISKLYSAQFKENDIVGEALIQLDPDALRDIGVSSVGHRLVILKAIFELKIKWGIDVDEEDWRPKYDGGDSHMVSGSNSRTRTATLAGVSSFAMMKALQERDERVRALELEIARLEDWLVRWTGEMGSSSRVDPLHPYFPPSKVYSSFPDGRSTPDNYQRLDESGPSTGHSSEESSAAAQRAPSSSTFSGPLTAFSSTGSEIGHTRDEMPSSSQSRITPSSSTFASHDTLHNYSSNHAPGNVSQMDLSPTSSSATPTSAHPPTSAEGKVVRIASPTASGPTLSKLQGNAAVSAAAASAAAAAASHQASSSTGQRLASSSGLPSPLLSGLSGTAESKSLDKAGGGAGGTASGTDTPYKSFRVTLDDPCHKVLPAALKKYKINDDWRQYALFICYGTTERCLSYDEKPLLLFQKLKEAKQNPVFMLRHIRDVKSPIAIASAKAAARKSAPGPAATNDGKKAKTSTTGPSSRAGRETGHPNGSLDENYVDSAPGQPKLTGPAAQLVESRPGGPQVAATDSFAIAIYPYVSEREDEFDVSVGDTFIVKSKAKGWWVVQRDAKATGQADVVGLAKGADGSPKNGGEIRSGWVPAGCLLETRQPLSSIMTVQQSISPKTPSEGTFSHQQQRTPTSPAALMGEDTTTPKPVSASLATLMASAPIPPALITSTSTPGVLLMDYNSPEENIHLKKDIRLRVFKRYNHWSYCVEEGAGHARAWLPSWYIGKVGSSRSAATATGSSSAGAPPLLRNTGSGRSEAVPLI